jgi:hypothetical protein
VHSDESGVGYMGSYRLKIKVGDHEFDADGPVDVVQAQFEAFKSLIATLPPSTAANKQVATTQKEADNSASANESALALDKIARVEDRVVSLTARPETLEDSLLLLLLGQRTFRANDAVTGGEVLSGLRQSGITVGRVDWRLDKLAGDGQIIKIGYGRASRYRLTNQGMNKAQGIARNLIAMVP